MSDPKEFLSRWSQRKLNPQPEKPAADQQQAALPTDGETSSKTPEAVPEFDISTLPPLESIGAASDIRAFLQGGVPASLARAALRRAWSADPAIRDFVGLSENSWDFNAPDSIPGFGSLNADEVRNVAARFFNEMTEETTGQAKVESEPITDQICAETQSPADLDSAPDLPTAPDGQDSPDVAMQQAETAETDETTGTDKSTPPRRRHGSALPE